MISAAPVVQGRLVALVSSIWCQTSFLESVSGERDARAAGGGFDVVPRDCTSQV